jgi:phage gp46-like protein
MSDIALRLFDKITFDVNLKDGDFESDEGLETAVAIALFSDRRVTDEELPLGQESKRGWWGDMYSEVDRDQIGSKLWTLAREKRTLETLRKTEDYAKEALKWMLEDGIAASIKAVATFEGEQTSGRWRLDIEILRPSGREFKYSVVWDAQKLYRG